MEDLPDELIIYILSFLKNPHNHYEKFLLIIHNENHLLIISFLKKDLLIISFLGNMLIIFFRKKMFVLEKVFIMY